MPILTGLAPILAANVRLVILGSFPGVASLQTQQYYGHPRNHFWPIVASLLTDDPKTMTSAPYTERTAWLLSCGIGVWDVYDACEREGSLDADIRHARLNDLMHIKRTCPLLTLIAHNGGESWRHAHHSRALGVPVMRLPSSSPAAASVTFATKVAAWRNAFVAAGLL